MDKQPMPFLQAIPPANLYALAHDHDYLQEAPEDQFIRRENVSVFSYKRDFFSQINVIFFQVRSIY